MTKKIGLLGLQGCLEPHTAKFAACGAETAKVLEPGQLSGLDALVIPGGESSTMLRAASSEMWQALVLFAAHKSVWGVCAGSILMAREVRNPQQRSLGLLDMVIERNAYGAQNESFAAELAVAIEPAHRATYLFIRAPRIIETGDAQVMAEHKGIPVMVRNGRHLATTFHPELTEDLAIHRWFLANCASD